jgi:WD40 repeat protein
MSDPRLRGGRSWRFDAPVIATAFDGSGTAAFALGDGTMRLMAPGVGESRTVEAHRGAVLALALHPEAGFLTGGDDGRLLHTGMDGASRELAHVKGRWIENVTSSRETGLIAYTAGKSATILHDDESTTFQHPSTAAGVAFDPKGRRLAVAHYDGASLWWAKAADQHPKILKWKGSHLGVTWCPDGRFIVTTMQENALHGWRLDDAADMRMSGYPAKVKCFVWDRRGRMLFTGGSSRVIGWPFTGRSGPMGREPMELGPERDALILVVATHPTADIVAAGTSDGTVWLESIGDPGAEFALLDGGKISALAFSPGGELLAVGTEDGYAALATV